ncbi:MAG: RIP metalloprotease RseP [Alphaproteobacteria bacterium]|nr:RIP metalloprotease RseP [Alphaproteobacteria bacterium]
MTDLSTSLAYALEGFWFYGVVFMLVLSGVIFIHEMGHFLMARVLGVRAEVFSVGFGREVFGWTDSKGTRWKFSWLPLGGYVRIFGESEPYHTILTDEEKSVAFYTKSLWHRTLIVFAGPLANFVFAVLVVALLFMTIGKPQSLPEISGIEVGSGADKAGLQNHDILLRINGTEMKNYEQIKNTIAPLARQELVLQIRRGTEILDIKAVPGILKEKDSFGHDTQRGYLGTLWPSHGLDIREINSIDGIDVKEDVDLARNLLIERLDKSLVINFGKKDRPADLRIQPPRELNPHLFLPHSPDFNTLTLSVRPDKHRVRLGLGAAIWGGLELTGKAVTQTLGVIYQMVVGSKSTSELGGFVKISTMTGDTAQRGGASLVMFIAILSINIGFLNLLPLPMLDGGHLAFHLAEWIRGKPPSPKVKGYIYGVGIVFLMGMVFLANLNDLIGFLSKK